MDKIFGIRTQKF